MLSQNFEFTMHDIKSSTDSNSRHALNVLNASINHLITHVTLNSTNQYKKKKMYQTVSTYVSADPQLLNVGVGTLVSPNEDLLEQTWHFDATRRGVISLESVSRTEIHTVQNGLGMINKSISDVSRSRRVEFPVQSVGEGAFEYALLNENEELASRRWDTRSISTIMTKRSRLRDSMFHIHRYIRQSVREFHMRFTRKKNKKATGIFDVHHCCV